MAKGTQLRRLIWLAVLLSLAFAGLGYRLVDLQVLRHEELSEKSQRNTQRRVLLEPRRGDILDIKGNLLATSVGVKRVCGDPTLLGDRQPDVARVLAPLLQESEATLVERLQPRVRLDSEGLLVTNLYVVLKQKVPIEAWERIQAAMAKLSFGDESKMSSRDRNFYRVLRQKAIFVEDDQQRIYPNQTLAAHVLGYVGTAERQIEDRAITEMVGQDGIESTFNSKLAGVHGWRLMETDVRKREVLQRREQNVEPRHGLKVVLTMDSVIQHIVESALAEAMEKHSPISISGVVVRPRTGEILALATLPTFDPNTRNAPPEARRNRVITDMAEPGSTFKIVTIAGALNEGVVRLNDVFDCEHGHFFYANRTLHDDHSYGPLSVEQIIAKSSNIGAAKVGIQLGQNRLYDYIKRFGFGELTGIPLPGEVSATDYVRPVKKWSKLTIAQLPMGHGLCTTRLQMTMAMCAIANQGWLMRPMLVDRLEDSEQKVVAKYAPQRVRQVITEATAKSMVQALKTAASPDGTGAKAALEHYIVAGKTGTAKKVEKDANGKLVYVAKHFSSFIGFFPADKPELCISITIDEPKRGYYGGQTAAPVFKQIAERAASYLSIPPDIVDPLPMADKIAGPVNSRALNTTARPAGDPDP